MNIFTPTTRAIEEAGRILSDRLDRIFAKLDELHSDLQELIGLFDVVSPEEPGKLGGRIISEGETGMLTIVVTLPPVKPEDKVVQRNLTVNGVPAQPITDVNLTETTEQFQVEPGDCQLSLSDQDKAGNVSKVHEEVVNFVSLDVTAPSEPGTLGGRIVADTEA